MSCGERKNCSDCLGFDIDASSRWRRYMISSFAWLVVKLTRRYILDGGEGVQPLLYTAP